MQYVLSKELRNIQTPMTKKTASVPNQWYAGTAIRISDAHLGNTNASLGSVIIVRSGPNVFNIVGFSPTKPPIPNGVFAEEVGTMARMKVFPPKPMRKSNDLGDLVGLHGVLKPTNDPLLDSEVVVHLESVKVASPHGTSRVVSPSDLGVGIGCELQGAVDKLHGFKPLLAQTLVVQHLKRLVEARVGQEGLHGRIIDHAPTDSRIISRLLTL